MLHALIVISIVFGTVSLTAAGSEEDVVSMVYVGEKGDNSYLFRAFQGLYEVQEEYHFSIRDIPWNTSEPVDLVTNPLGIRSDAVIIMGNILSGYEEEVVAQYPEVPVIIIDGNQVTGPKARSVYFSMYGASYLAGVLAANTTRTGKIGVIAGANVPVLRGFTDGFNDGARRSDPEVFVDISYIADDYSGFSMPEQAGILTGEMHRNGTDIIYQIAGLSGMGVIEVAKELPDLFIIGSDADQSGLAPDTVLASAVKNLDSVIYDELRAIFTESYTPGSENIGLHENGSSLVLNPRFEDFSPVIDAWRPEATQREKEYLASHP